MEDDYYSETEGSEDEYLEEDDYDDYDDSVENITEEESYNEVDESTEQDKNKINDFNTNDGSVRNSKQFGGNSTRKTK